ncbi:EF-hand domain-containing protein [Ulvibacterium marinum]|uniref:EF-hand domain-containing protein n=1 Tax=Ulvibacterium marinum TaxID=2419782 RepID=A0A3B0BYN3_9FLAO|nr:EF-hand domain-containing protein [Ulvibacterium marinum]RKN78162.1 EF-hand domain-containing protein [Ulvibacterium marinum]
MKQHLFSIAALAILVGTLSSCRSSNTAGQFKPGGPERQPPSASEIISRMDTDEDGKLSMSEVRGRLKERFGEIDTDDDGFLTKEEIEKIPRPRPRRR